MAFKVRGPGNRSPTGARHLASARPALAPKCKLIFAEALSPHFSQGFYCGGGSVVKLIWIRGSQRKLRLRPKRRERGLRFKTISPSVVGITSLPWFRILRKSI